MCDGICIERQTTTDLALLRGLPRNVYCNLKVSVFFLSFFLFRKTKMATVKDPETVLVIFGRVHKGDT